MPLVWVACWRAVVLLHGSKPGFFKAVEHFTAPLFLLSALCPTYKFSTKAVVKIAQGSSQKTWFSRQRGLTRQMGQYYKAVHYAKRRYVLQQQLILQFAVMYDDAVYSDAAAHPASRVTLLAVQLAAATFFSKSQF